MSPRQASKQASKHAHRTCPMSQAAIKTVHSHSDRSIDRFKIPSCRRPSSPNFSRPKRSPCSPPHRPSWHISPSPSPSPCPSSLPACLLQTSRMGSCFFVGGCCYCWDHSWGGAGWGEDGSQCREVGRWWKYWSLKLRAGFGYSPGSSGQGVS